MSAKFYFENLRNERGFWLGHECPTSLAMDDLLHQITTCRLCADRFRVTASRHSPRPVAWFRPTARLLIAGQAPGLRVQEGGRPLDNRSGDRLRDWLGIDRATFYDRDAIAIVPMAFCFPGYDAKGADLPPPPICGDTWHDKVFKTLTDLQFQVIVGGYAHRYHLGGTLPVTDRVAAWRDQMPEKMPLPHPSWRNTAWLKRNPWFETDARPALQTRVKEVLNGRDDTP